MTDTNYTGYSQSQAETYDENRFTTPQGRLFDRLEKRELSRSLESNSPLKILEVGCGTGRFTAHCLRQGHEVTAVDLSKPMLKQCQARTEEYNEVDYCRSEGACLPFRDSTFDFVFSIRTINQTESKQYALEMIEELCRVCQPGGTILVEYMNENSLTRIQSTDVLLAPDEVESKIEQISNVSLVETRGILFFSQTALELTPNPLLGVFEKLDTALANLLTRNCTRSYTEIQKMDMNSQE